MATLCQASGGSERTVRRTLAELSSVGIVVVQNGGGRNHTNTYRFQIERLEAYAENPGTMRGFKRQKP